MTEKTATRNGTKFVYVTYIRTTPEKLWEALIDPEFNKQYWGGCYQECGWEPGSAWNLYRPNGKLADSGEVLEIKPLKKLVLKWHHRWRPELLGEETIATMELDRIDELVKLTVTHESKRDGSQLIDAVSIGWPSILSSLQSLLETGKAHPSLLKCAD